MRKRRKTKLNPNQRDIFGTKIKRLKKCVFCEIDIDLDEDIFVADSLGREEAPFASHLLYTQVLNDEIQDERLLGMKNAFMWYKYADLMAVYIDLGVSKGMLEGIEKAHKYDIPIEIRKID